MHVHTLVEQSQIFRAERQRAAGFKSPLKKALTLVDPGGEKTSSGASASARQRPLAPAVPPPEWCRRCRSW